MTVEQPPAGVMRAGILGTGGVARLHAEALADLDGVELVAVADASYASAATFSEKHGSPLVFDDLAAMLAGGSLDVVHLCTPPAGHAEQASLAFAAGCDVVVEKPPALSLTAVASMEAAAADAGRMLAVVFQQRTGTAVAHLRQLLEEGALGRPRIAICHTLWNRGQDYYAVEWRGTWAGEGGGPTLGLGIHQIDLLAYLLGDWESASGTFWRLDRDTEMEDLATGTIVFSSGVVASVVTSVLAVREESLIRIDTDLATIELAHLYGHAHANWRITPAAGVPADEVARWALPENEVPSGHDAFLRETYEALRAGQSTPSVAADAARGLELVTALYASARLGRAVSHTELDGDDALRGTLSAPVIDLRDGQ
jgi:predicted dehydrogenase